MLVFGVDPGTATTGFGVLRINGKRFEVVDWGLIETDKSLTTGKRLEIIFDEMEKLLSNFKPDILAIEKIFFATNAKTAIAVGQAQGVMFHAASRAQISVIEYAPGTVKKAVTGSGRADKKLVQQSVRKVLGAKVRSEAHEKTHFDNAADALAVALCHAYNYINGGDKNEL